MQPSGKYFGSVDSSYLKFLEMEHEEILKNKWLISEKMGQDCGMDYAVWDWAMRKRHVWVSGLKANGQYPL